jgi:single-strand DNA-binding protein
MNTVILIGRLGADPEAPKSEKAPVTFSLAVDRRGDDEPPDWFDVSAFGPLGAAVAKSCKQGRQVCVRGRLVHDRWQNAEGEARSRVKIIAAEIQFLAKPRGAAGPAEDETAEDEEEAF